MEHEAYWALAGVIIGAISTGIINYLLQLSQFKHNKDMYYLQNQSKEQVKEILLELLNHRTYTDRSFSTIRKRIGGYTDDELKLLLHEVGAKKSISRTDDEWWYLKDRTEERNEKRKNTKSV